jgi:hypothetical protein
MAIQIYINNEEVVSDKQINIKEEFLATSSTILNNVFPKSWLNDNDTVSRFYFPPDYSDCKILKEGNLIFNGIVKNTGNISLNPYEPKFCSLQILDYKTLLSEGKTLDFVIDNKTIGEAIEMVIDEISSYGFVKGTIDIASLNDIIGAYSTLDKTAYDVFQYLSEIANCKWFTRRIDANTIAIDFYDNDKIPNASDIEYTKEYFNTNKIIDMTYNYSANDYRNSQQVISSGVISNSVNSEVQTYNGTDTQIFTDLAVGSIQDIQINDVSMSFASNIQEELGIDADFYYTVGNNQLKINTDIARNDKIEIIYYPYVKGRQLVENEEEINRINTQTGRNGRISRYESRNDVASNEELYKIAKTYIDVKGQSEITLTITTKDNDLFNIGQQVYFNAPLDELKKNYLVKAKEIQITQTGNDGMIFYKYTLSSTYNGENAINFFDNQRRKNSGNIEEGQFITRYIDINNTCNIIFDNLKIEEATNELNSELDIEI